MTIGITFWALQAARAQTAKNPALRAKSSVQKLCQNPLDLGVLGLQLSERQIPQVVGFIRSVSNQREPLERAAVIVRQAL